MKPDDPTRREVVAAFAASTIAFVAICILITLVQASSTTRLASIPLAAGALLPAVSDTKSKLGSISTVARHAFRDAGRARDAWVQDAEEPDVVSIVPATRTGPITFEITTLRVPLAEPATPAKCELHKGFVHADTVSCKRCGAVYCKACASQLAGLGEPCWACHHELEW